MSSIRFNHVFAALLVLSALTAFVIPKRYTERIQPQVQSLFYPVARPVGALAAWASGRVSKEKPTDTRDAKEILRENEYLRQELAAAFRDLEEQRRINEERSRVGPIREFCTPVTVIGPDAGNREGLLLRGSTLEGLREGQYVLFSNSIAGKIDKPPGVGGASVRLITDRGHRVGAYFIREHRDKTGPDRFERLSKMPPALVEGVGNGAMRCATDITKADVDAANLQPGDWAVVEDTDWDPRVQGRVLGKVVYVGTQNRAPLYSEIRIEPTTNLIRLREVMVLTK
jgi:hypothetical protein